MSVKKAQIPPYAICSPEQAAKYARDFEQGRWHLLIDEVFWRERYNFLRDCGYQLRPRLAPEWTPSWLGTNRDPFFCEDSICSMV